MFLFYLNNKIFHFNIFDLMILFNVKNKCFNVIRKMQHFIKYFFEIFLKLQVFETYLVYINVLHENSIFDGILY